MEYKSPTYREKFMLTIAFFLLLLVLAYKFSFIETMSIKQECSRLENELLKQQETEDKIREIEYALNNQQLFGNQGNLDATHFQKALLDELANYCKTHKVVLESSERPHVYLQNKYELNTQVFKVKGTFHELIKMVNHFESSFDLSNISSLEIESVKDRNTGKINVYATIYLQKISIS